MMIRLLPLLLALAAQAQQKALFYLTRDPASIRSFREHAGQIDIVVPAWYRTDGAGSVSGQSDPDVLKVARQARVEVMPIIVNPGFRKEVFHQLAASPAARRRMVETLLAECARDGHIGIQFDFEGVASADRDLLTRLVEEAAGAFHKRGLRLSLAAVPRSTDTLGKSSFAQWSWNNLQGAYDVSRLGKTLDFLSWMTYDQHMKQTTPGPIAGYPWVVDQLSFLLRHVPKGKISLGIPQYGRRWHSTARGMEMATVSYSEATSLARQFGVPPEWDAVERAPWFSFYRDEAREYVFYNDARSFQERVSLAQQQQLHGFSTWVLGMEDPAIWSKLPRRR
jgi:spore germination protein YaaH